MGFKFEQLDVWHDALAYADAAYALSEALPTSERFNLADQLRRASTSVALNIAEGSTGQTDAEHARFVGLAIRSLVETVACVRLIERRGYVASDSLASILSRADQLARRLQALRRCLSPDRTWAREPTTPWSHDEPATPFDSPSSPDA